MCLIAKRGVLCKLGCIIVVNAMLYWSPKHTGYLLFWYIGILHKLDCDDLCIGPSMN